jgi:hypothetical protein
VTDAADLITLIFGGKTFRCSRRTAAHLAWTAARLEQQHPDARIVVIQGCYNQGVPASEGTHDFDAVLDVQIVGLGWDEAQRFLRECGWAAWVRSPPAFPWHIHMVSIGYPGRVGIYVPAQVDDYYRHALGLKGQHASGDDPTWHPADIDSTVFDYPLWLEDQPMNADDKAWLENLIDTKLAANNPTLVKAVWDAVVDRASHTARAALRKAAGL